MITNGIEPYVLIKSDMSLQIKHDLSVYKAGLSEEMVNDKICTMMIIDGKFSISHLQSCTVPIWINQSKDPYTESEGVRKEAYETEDKL